MHKFTKIMDRFAKRMPLGTVACLVVLMTTGGCQPHEGSENQLKEDVDSFATYYYNWHFRQAAKFCTSESEVWLQYASSNVHQADLDLLHNKQEDAVAEVQDVEFGDDEISANVHLKVSNFYRMDTIGTEAHLVKEADVTLPMVIHEGHWKVQLNELP